MPWPGYLLQRTISKNIPINSLKSKKMKSELEFLVLVFVSLILIMAEDCGGNNHIQSLVVTRQLEKLSVWEKKSKILKSETSLLMGLLETLVEVVGFVSKERPMLVQIWMPKKDLITESTLEDFLLITNIQRVISLNYLQISTIKALLQLCVPELPLLLQCLEIFKKEIKWLFWDAGV